MGYIDLHCDTLMQAFLAGQKNAVRLEKAMADLERLETGGCAAQFFAIFMPPMAYRARYGDAIPDDETYIRLLRGILQNTVEAGPTGWHGGGRGGSGTLPPGGQNRRFPDAGGRPPGGRKAGKPGPFPGDGGPADLPDLERAQLSGPIRISIPWHGG